jgi:hypothetical protein
LFRHNEGDCQRARSRGVNAFGQATHGTPHSVSCEEATPATGSCPPLPQWQRTACKHVPAPNRHCRSQIPWCPHPHHRLKASSALPRRLLTADNITGIAHEALLTAVLEKTAHILPTLLPRLLEACQPKHAAQSACANGLIHAGRVRARHWRLCLLDTLRPIKCSKSK